MRARSAAAALSAEVPVFAGLRSLALGADEDRLVLVSLLPSPSRGGGGAAGPARPVGDGCGRSTHGSAGRPAGDRGAHAPPRVTAAHGRCKHAVLCRRCSSSSPSRRSRCSPPSRTLLDPGRLPGAGPAGGQRAVLPRSRRAARAGLAGPPLVERPDGLRPVLALGLGRGGLSSSASTWSRAWCGCCPGAVYAAALAHAGTAFLLVALPLAGPLLFSMGLPPGTAVGAAALLGAAASLSSGHFAVLGYRSGRMDRATRAGRGAAHHAGRRGGPGRARAGAGLGATGHPAEGLGLVALALLLGVACGGAARLPHARAEGPRRS